MASAHMANNNAPFGLLPLSSARGAAPNYEMAYAPIAYNDTTKIGRGDPLSREATGYVARWTASDDVGNLVGIFWGCHYLSTSQGTPVWAQYWGGADVAAAAQGSLYCSYIPINTATPALFYAQSDSTGVAFADIGMNIDMTMADPNTTTGASQSYLNATSTIATTNTLPFRIVDLYGSPSGFGNWGGGGIGGIQPGSTGPYTGSATGAYNWVIVQANVTSSGTGI